MQISTMTGRRRGGAAMAVSLLLVVLAAGLPGIARAQQSPPPVAPAVTAPATPRTYRITSDMTLVLVRSALIALDQANKTGNYSVLRDLGSPDFRRRNSVAQLSDTFSAQREAGLDLGGAAILQPTITGQPQTDKSGMLRLAGYFPLNGDSRLNFELAYVVTDQKLLLSGINVVVTGTQAAAASAAPPPAAPPPPATKITPGKAEPKPKQVAKPAPKPKSVPKPKQVAKPKPVPKPQPEVAPAQ